MLSQTGNRALSMLDEREAEIQARADIEIDGDYDAQGVYIGIDIVTFLEREMYLADTQLPMELHPEQKAVLQEMFRRDEHGKLIYTTILYSSIKKSAKTTIGAGIALWQAFRVPYGEVFIIGNDLKQADSRMAQALRDCIKLNPRMQNIKLPTSTYRVVLPNHTRIETIPVDPAGEAGMNPTGLFWTEAWGAKQAKHELLWTEAQISPTRLGNSFRFVESYAGHSGESLILERLYESIVRQGTPLTHAAPELYARGTSIAYWCTRPYLPWQTDAYYQEQATSLIPSEYGRIHKNEWATSTSAFVDIIWWDACRTADIPVDAKTPQIMALDAGVTSDCFACVCVTKRQDVVQVLHVKLWTPELGKPLDFDAIEEAIKEYREAFNVLEVVYDPYQLAQMAQRLRKSKTRVHEFEQGGRRSEADTGLRYRIMNQRIAHDGNADLRNHMTNANAKSADDSKLHIVKRHADFKIDAVVALSMAAKRADELALERFTK